MSSLRRTAKMQDTIDKFEDSIKYLEDAFTKAKKGQIKDLKQICGVKA